MKNNFKKHHFTLLLGSLIALGSNVLAQTTGTTGFWDLNGNTGISGNNFIGTSDYKPIKFKTNNAVRMVINANGKVGIGNQSPLYKLDIKGGSINTDSLYRINGIQVLNRNASNQIQIGDNTAKVGIGTATSAATLSVFNTADATLHLQGTTRHAKMIIERLNQDTAAMLEFKNIGGLLGNHTWQTGMKSGSNDYIINNIGVGTALTILRSNGNVGIGTGNPQARLDVSGQIKCSGGIEVNGTLKVSGGAAGQVLTYEAATGNAIWQTPTGSISGTGAANRISFWTGTTSLSSNANLFWDNTNSRLGIGTASPSTAVDINGQIKISGGSPGLGKVLVSDAAGLASWQNISGSGLTGSGTTGRFSFWNSSSSISSTTNLFWDNVNNRVGINNASPSVPLHVSGGTDVSLASGGYLVCGSITGNNVTIDENEIMARSNSLPATLTLNNNGGNLVIDGTFTGTLVGIGLSSPAYQLHLSANSAAKPLSSTWTVTSDARLKKDVSDFNDGLSLVQKIHPVWFNYTGEAGMPTNEKGVGTLAQELQKLAPYMVKEWTYTDKDGGKKNYLAVDYGAMDFVLVNAIKEQQVLIEKKNSQLEMQQEEINELKSKFAAIETALSQCCNAFEGNAIGTNADIKIASASTEKASLEQNIPNPFTERTLIKYFIPQQSIFASLRIYKMDGTEVLNIKINNKGFGQSEISGGTLAAGIYTYILLADGKVVDSRQMILSK
ncbi:MAG: tail fiber domain-containing protein [Bacteroidetes bacterium]|nr:tail fiber domain-containing protein [Bacteroidota bacterium]